MLKKFFGMMILGAGLLLQAMAENGVESLLSCDFRQNWQKFTIGQGRVTGELPTGWQDDSAWGRVWIRYSHENFQSENFLRVKIDRMENGRQQLSYRGLPEIPAGGALYHLRFKVRSHSSVNLIYGLRMVGMPYGFYWQHAMTAPGEWQTVEHDIQLNPEKRQAFGLWITCATVGDYDISEVSLEKIAVDRLAAQLKQQYPDGGPANLFRHSVFPLGLQNGWSLGRNCSDGDMVKVTTPTDRDGMPVMRFASPDQPLVVFSAPFQVVAPEQPHCVRLEVRGRGKWAFNVRINSQNKAAAAVELNDTWRWVEIPFQTSIMALGGQLRIDGRGTLELKRLAVGPADRVAKEQPGTRPEVALGIPDSAAAAARIQFGDEPAAVKYAVVAAPADSILQLQVCDLYGQTRKLTPITLKSGAAAGQLAYTPTPELCGSYRIEAWLEHGGKTVSPINELVVHRVRRPAGWGVDRPESAFGIHTLPTTRHLLMAKAAGFNWVRLHDSGLEYVGWWNLEKERGKWTFHDREIQAYRNGHMEILGEFGTAPAWASYQSRTVRKDKNEYHDKFFQPLDLNDYGRYVQTVAKRYRDQIHAWDVWNEPWINGWWGVDYDRTKTGRAGYITSKTPGQDFAKLMRTAYQAAKEVAPETVIMGFNTSDNPANSDQTFSGNDWTSMVMAGGGIDFCDRLCYHCYTSSSVGYPGDSVTVGLEQAFGPLVKKYGKVPKRVWMTEGSPTSFMVHNGIYKYSALKPSGEDVALVSDRCCRYIVSLLANRVEKFFLYSMHCHTGEFMPTPADWRMLTNDDGYMHPSGVAVANLAGLVDGVPFVRTETLKPGVYAYLFSNGKRSVAVISGLPTTGVKLRPLPTGVAALDLYGNPLADPIVYRGQVVYLQGDMSVETLQKALQIE